MTKSRHMLTVLVPIVVALIVPLIIRSEYKLYVVTMAGIYGILAISLNIVMGLCGMVSLGHAAFWAIGAYTAGFLLVRFHVPFLVALFAGAVLSGIAGAVLGVPSLKVRSLYLVVTTIGFNIIVELILNNWISVTGGPDGMPNIPPPSFGPLVINTPQGKYVLVALMLLLCIWAFSRIRASRVGRAFQAIKGNELAAQLSGVNVHYYKVLAFALSSAVAGIAGVLFACLVGYISPDTFMHSISSLFITMMLVGGSGSVWGPLIGAGLLQFLSEGMRFMKDYYMALYGLLTVIIAIRMPGGLEGLLRSAWDRFCTWVAQRREGLAGKGA